MLDILNKTLELSNEERVDSTTFKENQLTDSELLKQIGTNIKILKNGEKFDFIEFINDHEINVIAVNSSTKFDTEYFNLYSKIEMVKGIYQILIKRYNTNPILNLSSSLGFGNSYDSEVIGYYSSYQNCFYSALSYLQDNIDNEIELSNINIDNYYDLIKNLNIEVNQ